MKKEYEAPEKLSIGNAQIFSRNFSGRQGEFNPEGVRNFCVILPDDIAEQLAKDGWNIKRLKPRDPDETPKAFTQIRVSYGGKVPPVIVLITSRNKTNLSEKDINVLDFAEIVKCDMIINPYHWEKGGKSGVKGYLSRLYVTIREDEFAEQYENVPDSAISSFDNAD